MLCYQVTAVFVQSEIVQYSLNGINMNSDRIPIIFFILYIFYRKYLFTHRSINDNFLIKNDNYLVKKCLIFSEYFEINQIDHHLW
jgi:hypothetical protein